MVIIKSPKIVVFLQALYSIQGLCNPLMGVFDVNHALLFLCLSDGFKNIITGKSREKLGKEKANRLIFKRLAF